MKIRIQSHFQIAAIAHEEERPAVELPNEGGRSTVLKQVKSLHIKRHLSQANKSLENLIGDQNSDTDDPFGRVLRRLRIHKGLQASEVASRACITVWQLCELETGKDTLFYTSGLRLKAAQRVAEFLGTDWSDILQGRVMLRAVPTPTAQLHLLKTTRAGEHMDKPPTNHPGAFGKALQGLRVPPHPLFQARCSFAWQMCRTTLEALEAQMSIAAVPFRKGHDAGT